MPGDRRVPIQTKRLAQPNAADVQHVLNLLSSARLAETEAAASKLAARFPGTFILHHALGVARDGLGKYPLAIESYRSAIRLQPHVAELHFNLGITLGRCNQFREAVRAYQEAIRLNPKFFQAYGNLGALLQKQGQMEEAVATYQRGLAIDPHNALGHFNLGTALRALGRLDDAMESYRRAVEHSPSFADAHNNLGETLRDQGDMPAAVKSYEQALALNPQHQNANFNMAEYLALAKRFDEASNYFEASQLDDWQARSLYCLYRAERFDKFKARLTQLSATTRHTSPFIGTLAAHYAINFGVDNPYRFCGNGAEFVYRKRLPELTEPGSPLLAALIKDIDRSEIAERTQGRLHFGTQSAGNLFMRPEASFRTLSELVKRAFIDYRQQFADADCELIQSFPQTLDFTSSWFVKMQKGGHLDPHIHEIGWISGAVYLAMPSPKHHPDEGAFEYGFHGDSYPQRHPHFPVGLIRPEVGDIVLFPSSLFHRTIPFHSDDHRICIAFDLKPGESGAQSARARH
jgi:tetratricopeptide (TPR) repeat protein